MSLFRSLHISVSTFIEGNEEDRDSTLIEQEEPDVVRDNQVPTIQQIAPEPAEQEPGSHDAPSQLQTRQDPQSNTSVHLGTPGPSVHVQAIAGQGESPADFRSPKRRRVISPAKSSVKEGEKDTGEDEGEDGEVSVVDQKKKKQGCKIPLARSHWRVNIDGGRVKLAMRSPDRASVFSSSEFVIFQSFGRKNGKTPT